MARLTGNDGSITLPTGHNGVMNTWRATVRPVVSNVTGFSDTSNQRNRAGLPAITGSASGVVASNEANSAPNADGIVAGGGTITLLADSTNTSQWAFTGLISGVTLDVNKLGDTRLTFDFTTGDADDFAETWEETP